MAVKIKFGLISGDSESLDIDATVWEENGLTLDFDDAIAAVMLNAPADIYGLVPTGDTKIKERSRSVITFSIPYGQPTVRKPPEPPEEGTLVRRAACSAKSKELWNYILPIGVYDNAGDATEAWGDVKWAVDLSVDERGYYNGQKASFDPLTESRTLDYYAPNSFISEAYLDVVEDIVSRGCFNSAPFAGKPIGSVQLVRFSLSERSPDDWELSFGFGYQRPRVNTQVGDIVVPHVRACDYLWTLFKQEHEEGQNHVGIKPRACFVGQVWELADFSLLQLP